MYKLTCTLSLEISVGRFLLSFLCYSKQPKPTHVRTQAKNPLCVIVPNQIIHWLIGAPEAFISKINPPFFSLCLSLFPVYVAFAF